MPSNKLSIEQPAVLITGAAKRIGKAIALRMAREGYTVLLHYHRSQSAAAVTAAEINQLGAECHLLQANLAVTAEVRDLVRRALEKAPNCRHLVNSASIFEPNTLGETSEDLFDRHLAINFKAPFFLTQQFAAHCTVAGSVINLLDTRIRSHSISHFAYSLSKKMLYEFTKMAAKELAPRLRVNGVCPGLILPAEDEDDSYLARKSATIPLQHSGDVADVVDAVCFLRDSSFITGDCLFLDGGEHLG